MEEQKDPKKACGACLESIPLDEELYRLGNTKACDDIYKKTNKKFMSMFNRTSFWVITCKSLKSNKNSPRNL